MVTIPLLVGLAVYKRLPGPGRWITWLMATWFITECIALYLRKNGYGTWNLYVLLSFAEIVIVTTFYRQIFTNERAKSTAAWLAWIGIAVGITEYAWMAGPANSITMMYECVFFIAMGLYAFYEMFSTRTGETLSQVNFILIVMFLGSGIYFASWHWMRNTEALFKLFAGAHAWLLVICYPLFAYSLWKLQS